MAVLIGRKKLSISFCSIMIYLSSTPANSDPGFHLG